VVEKWIARYSGVALREANNVAFHDPDFEARLSRRACSFPEKVLFKK
jgi:hypothetical protein